MKIKTSNRLMSVLLAIVILVTSLSVGLSAFAIGDPYKDLIDALSKDGVKKASWGYVSGKDGNYFTEISDPTGDIEEAVKAFWKVAKKELPEHTGDSSDKTGYRNVTRNVKRTAKGLSDAVLDKLKAEPYNLSGDEYRNAEKALKAFSGAMYGTNDTYSRNGYPDSPGERNYGIKVIKNLKTVLLAENKNIEKLPETVTVAQTYMFEHAVGKYEEMSGRTNYYYTYNYLKEDGMKVVDVEGGKDEIAALKAFGSHFNKDLLKKDISGLPHNEVEKLVAENQKAVDSLGDLWGQEEIINHFFGSKDEIENFIVKVSKELDVKTTEKVAAEIKELMKKNPVGMDLENLTVLLNDVATLKAKFDACSKESKKAALKNVGLTEDEISSFIIKVNEEKEVIELKGFRKTVDEAINGFVIEGAERQAILDKIAVVTEQLSMITARTVPAIERVFPEGTEYIAEFLKAAEKEIGYLDLSEKALLDYFVYFNEDLLNTDLKTLSTNELIDERLKEGRAKLDEINKYDEDTVKRVFGEKYDQINAYFESIYTILTDRITRQGNEVFGHYKTYNKITLHNHNEVEKAIGNLETQIYDIVEDRLSPEFKENYAKVASMAEELKHYNDTFGVEGYIKTKMSYPVRDAMHSDMVRTEDEAYKVTNESLNAVVSQLNNVMSDEKLPLVMGLNGALSEFIRKTVREKAYNDDTVNKLVSFLYSTVVGIVEPMEMDAVVIKLTGKDAIRELNNFGIGLYPEYLATKINGEKYPEVKAALEAAGQDWSKYDKTAKWNVTDRESFIAAVCNAMNGLSPMLRVALGNQNLTGNILVASLNITHMDLYDKAVLPLLESFEIEGLMSTEEFNKLETAEQMMSAILNPVFNWADKLIDAPFTGLIDLLPKMAYIFDHDMITAVLKNTKVDVKVKAIITIDALSIIGVKDKSLYGVLNHFAPELDLSFLGDMNELVKLGLKLALPEANIVLPTIKQSALAGHGEIVPGVPSLTSKGTRYQLVTDKGDTLLAVLRYVIPLLADSDLVNAVLNIAGDLLGQPIELPDNVKKIIRNIGMNTDNVICAIVELFVPQEYKSSEINFLGKENPGQPINTVNYSFDWSQRKADYLDRNLAEYVDNLVRVLGGTNAPSLSHVIKSFIKNDVYTNDTVTSIVLFVKEQLKKIDYDLKPMMKAIGIDPTLWTEVEKGYQWGFEDGDKEGFEKALTKALSPFGPYLATIFAGEDTVVLSTARLHGYNGYTNGMVPLFEAIGCNPDDILTLEEYKAAVKADNSKAVELLLVPVFNLLERIYNNPVDELLDIAPNVIYFANSGGFNAAVKNSAQAMLTLLDIARPIMDINIDLDINVFTLMDKIISMIKIDGKPLGIKLPFLSHPQDLIVGNVVPYESKSGKTLYRIENPVEADFITVMMRTVIETAFYEDNITAITNLIADRSSLTAQQTGQLSQILNTLTGLYKQVNGVDKTLNAIYILFRGSGVAMDTSVAAISGFNRRWSAVFEKFYNSGDPTLVALAEKADETLSFLSLGIVNSKGIGSAGLISIGQKAYSFFTGRVGSVYIDKTEAELLEGDDMSLKASVYPIHAKNKNVIWQSNNPDVADVENGVVTAKRAGKATITATTEDGNLTVSCVVTVKADKAFLEETLRAMNGVSLEGVSAEKAEAFKNALNDATDVSRDPVATKTDVDKTLEVLLAAFKNLHEDYKEIESVKITSDISGEASHIKVNVKWYGLYSNKSVQLKTNILPENAAVKRIEWSADGSISVDENGLCTPNNFGGFGKRSGNVTVTAYDYDGNVYTDTVKVTFQRFGR